MIQAEIYGLNMIPEHLPKHHGTAISLLALNISETGGLVTNSFTLLNMLLAFSLNKTIHFYE